MSGRPAVRAPQTDGAYLIVPPWSEVGAVLAANRASFSQSEVRIRGTPLAEWRRAAAAEAVQAARAYLAEAGEPLPPASPTDRLILAGHQPELFHPGVWVKNFALAGLAHAHQATALNLIVDNDIPKTTALRLPALPPDGGPSAVYLAALPFDHLGEAPYEEWAVRDEGLFASLPERAAELTRDWPFTPILPAFWAEALRQRDRTPLVGERLAAARRALERRWGCHNLELPISRLCRTPAFAQFVAHLLDDLPRFHAVYNDCVHDYRRRHGLRSANHPVPDLARDGDWLEAPFWVWRVGATRRGRLFARSGPGDVRWRADGRGPELVATEWKLRTRALTTTLYARLGLGELFVHGIGGGIYDELTDDIIRRYFGLAPPRFLIVSGTLRLPITPFPHGPDDARRLGHELRDLVWNPQRHLPAIDGVAQELATAKAELARTHPRSPPARRERFQELRQLTVALRPFAADRARAVETELAAARTEAQANARLARRDFAFCLFPEEQIRSFCAGVGA